VWKDFAEILRDGTIGIELDEMVLGRTVENETEFVCF
jgi:hypothetical protein